MILPIIACLTYFLLLKYLKVPINLQIDNHNTTNHFIDYCDEPICFKL